MNKNSSINELFELIQVFEDLIDSLWNSVDEPYPQSRMTSLIYALSNFLIFVYIFLLNFF